MACELLQDYAFHQISLAVMATANAVTGTPTSASSESGAQEGGFFDVFRRKFSKVQDVLQGFTAPLKRRSMYDELPEHVWPSSETIELSRFRGRGHNFRPCQLSNPTWCDYCGDFIWGLYKQCQKCENCHLTSHEHCVPLVNLNCITVPEDGPDAGLGTPAGGSTISSSTGGGGSYPASPSDPKASLETSLSLSNTAIPRPGSAKNVSPNAQSHPSTVTSASGHQQQQQCRVAAPSLQEIARSHSLPECSHMAGGGDGSSGRPEISHQGQAGAAVAPSGVSNASSPSSGGGGQQYSHHQHQQHARHSSSPCLPGLPPPPSAIDQLTQGNDDARFITSHGQYQHPQCPRPSPYLGHTPHHPLSQHQHPTSPDTAATTPTPKVVVSPIAEEHSSSSSSSPKQQQHPSSSSSSAQSPSHSHHGSTTEASQSSLSLKPEGEPGAEEKDETDSGYRSGTIPDDKLPKVPSQSTLDRQELKRKIAKYNHFVPAASLEMTGKDSFQGFIKVTMNLIRPITMELGARPPSIYELLTREHIIEENTQQVAFYMPRDTHKSLHITSETTTKDVVSSLLKKFHILDHPRKFAMYEQEFNDKNKLVRLRRLADKNCPLVASVAWDPERIKNYRMVLQENETGEIVWEAFSLPELGNFLKVLDREEKEMIQEMKHRYTYMKQIIDKRLVAEMKGGKPPPKRKSLTTSDA